MPRGDKSKYTEKQKRQAEHIEDGYRSRGLDEPEAEKRAWATVNKMTGGGKRPGGSGQGKPLNKEPAKKGGRMGGRAAASRPAQQRSAVRTKSRTNPQAQCRRGRSRRPAEEINNIATEVNHVAMGIDLFGRGARGGALSAFGAWRVSPWRLPAYFSLSF